MKAFVATSLKNSEEALRVIRILEELLIGCQCCITERGDLSGQALFDHNYRGILEADLFISILKDLGKDVSTEIGMAYSLKKRRIGINYNANPQDLMPYFASGEILPEKEFRRKMLDILGERQDGSR